MPVEIETFGDTNQQVSIRPGGFRVIDGFDPRIFVFCDKQDQKGAIPEVKGKAGYDVLHFVNDDDLTGEVIDLATPVEFSGSVTIGIATPTTGRVVLLRHVPSQSLEPETTLVAVPA